MKTMNTKTKTLFSPEMIVFSMTMFIIVGMSKKSKMIGFSILAILLVAIGATLPSILLTASSTATTTTTTTTTATTTTNTTTTTTITNRTTPIFWNQGIKIPKFYRMPN